MADFEQDELAKQLGTGVQAVNHRDYAPDYFDKIETGTAVEGQPGMMWQHTGSGWAMAPDSAGAPPAAGGTPPGTTGGTPPGTTGGTQDVAAQAAGAQTNSATPQAAPDQATANQGTQDVVLNSWLQKASQGTQVDTNDPNFRQQADTYAASQERARRNAVADSAEGFAAQGMGGSGAQDVETRMLNERAGQNSAGFESALIGSELANRRDEIKQALMQLGNTISGDQQRALQKQLADLEAAIKREGIASGQGLGYAELGIKDKLGTGALNVDLMRALLGNQNFNDGQSLGWSQLDWQTNPMNPNNF